MVKNVKNNKYKNSVETSNKIKSFVVEIDNFGDSREEEDERTDLED